MFYVGLCVYIVLFLIGVCWFVVLMLRCVDVEVNIGSFLYGLGGVDVYVFLDDDLWNWIWMWLLVLFLIYF